jgi:hypothetical protein
MYNVCGQIYFYTKASPLQKSIGNGLKFIFTLKTNQMKKLLLSIALIISIGLNAQLSGTHKTFQLENIDFNHFLFGIKTAKNEILALGEANEHFKDKFVSVMKLDSNLNNIKIGDAPWYGVRFYKENDGASLIDYTIFSNGDIYVVSNSMRSYYTTPCVFKLLTNGEIDDSFQKNDDTGFVSFHNFVIQDYKDKSIFHNLVDTPYCEPAAIKKQGEDKILLLSTTRQVLSEYSNQETESDEEIISKNISIQTKNEEAIASYPLSKTDSAKTSELIEGESAREVPTTSELDNEDGESTLIRFMKHGDLDKSFGKEGTVHINLSAYCEDAIDMAVDNQGNIYVLGKYEAKYRGSISGTYCAQIFILKLKANGKIDSSFANQGLKILTYPMPIAKPKKILITKNQDIIIGINIESKNPKGGFDYYIDIVKLTKNGDFDKKFKNEGEISLKTVGISFLNNMKILDDDKIFIVGNIHNSIGEYIKKFEKKNKETIKTNKTYDIDSQVSVGFMIQLKSNGDYDSSFLNHGKIYLQNDNIEKDLVFNDFIINDDNSVTVLGSNRIKENSNTGAMISYIATKLDFGEIACEKPSPEWITPEGIKNIDNILLYPNPIKDNASIEFNLCKTETINIFLYDMSGRIVQEIIKNKTYEKGSFKEDFSTNEQIPSGNYIINIKGAHFNKSLQVIIAR